MNTRPSKPGKVVQSINMFGDAICVDLFERDNGTFGFEEYRRDSETGEGWFPIGHYSGNVFETPEEARSAARESVAWLDSQL